MATDTDQRKERLLGALAGLAIGEETVTKPLSNLMSSILEMGKPPFEEAGEAIPEELQSLAKKISKKLNIPDVQIKTLDKGVSTAFWGEEPYIGLRRPSTAELAHELGHMKPSIIRSLSSIFKKIKPIGLGAGIGAALSDDESLQAAAPFISGVPFVPSLLEELRASAHGTRGLASTVGSSDAAIAAITKLTPAFITYLLPALAAVAAPLVAKAVWQYAAGREKTAARIPFKLRGRLKVPTGTAWMKPPKPKQPKSTNVDKPKKSKPEVTPKEKPPSKKKFFSDMRKRLTDQRYGSREAVS